MFCKNWVQLESFGDFFGAFMIYFFQLSICELNTSQGSKVIYGCSIPNEYCVLLYKELLHKDMRRLVACS